MHSTNERLMASKNKLELESNKVNREWNWLPDFALIVATLGKVWSIAAEDPRKVIHGVKVGIALVLVSLTYYIRPLYDGVGGSALWAILTVVVVFEFTVGGCLYKGCNRAVATLCAAGLALGMHWLACRSGETLEPIVHSVSLFLVASVATFSRFIPAVKARFDYGVTVFLLTYCLIAISSYRVDELLSMAKHRTSNISIGICICISVCVLICPVWSGEELHLLIACNMDKLADFLEGYVEEHRKNSTFDGSDSSSSKLQGYKCVLSSHEAEKSQARLARWEPMHGNFGLWHPWSQYLKVGDAMRSCAYCIDSLSACNKSKNIQEPGYVGKQLDIACLKLSSNSSKVFRELSCSFKSMKTSCCISLLVGDMHDAVKEAREALESFANKLAPLSIATPTALEANEEKQKSILTASASAVGEIMPIMVAASLLIEISARIDQVVHATDTLSKLAGFAPVAVKGKNSSAAHQPQENVMQVLEV